ncbi:MAG: LPS export ABC transporter permease LptF [Rickettsiales bacterium]|nr:LPS export ABC transporter permease LptF [Rickettsiales bacterium]
MLRQYHLYILKLLAWPVLLITFSLTSIIWLTQALRFIDFIINRGLSVIDFVHITLLLVPSLLTIILPISLFISVLFSYNKLIADSEMVVMKACGLSPWQLARPALAIGLMGMLISYAISLYVMPASSRQFNEIQDYLRDNYTSVLLQEEVFNHPAPGLTVFVRKRQADGTLEGILVQDSRLPGQDITMMARQGNITQTAAGPRFNLVKGTRQERRDGRISWLDFDSYDLDLSFYTKNTQARERSARERYLGELFEPEASLTSAQRDKLRAEAHQRLTWPFYTLGLSMFAAAVLLDSEFNRRGRWKRMTVVSVIGLVIVISSLGLNNIAARVPILSVLMYTNALTVVLISGYMLLRPASMTPRGVWEVA